MAASRIISSYQTFYLKTTFNLWNKIVSRKGKKQKKYYQIYWGTKKGNILYFPMAKRTQEQKLNSPFLLTQKKYLQKKLYMKQKYHLKC